MVRRLKGEFCSPIGATVSLTITDFATRYLLRCEALASTKESAFTVFERAFKTLITGRHRTDNGIPFGVATRSTGSRACRLGLRLGIALERITPGHPNRTGAMSACT